MRRLLPLLASLMLVLTLWSGVAAHASETVEPAIAEAVAHFDGDRDQVPADEHGSVPHHHGICHADHVGIPAALAPADAHAGDCAPFRAKPALLPPSAATGAELRPPIA